MHQSHTKYIPSSNITHHHGHICDFFPILMVLFVQLFHPHGHICASFFLMVIFVQLFSCLVIFVCAGLAENGLENLPCPSSLLLGVLVTLLPKVIIVVIKLIGFPPKSILLSRKLHPHSTSVMSSDVPSLSKDNMKNRTFIKFSSLDGSPIDAVLPWFCLCRGQVSLLRPWIPHREWGGLQVTAWKSLKRLQITAERNIMSPLKYESVAMLCCDN